MELVILLPIFYLWTGRHTPINPTTSLLRFNWVSKLCKVVSVAINVAMKEKIPQIISTKMIWSTESAKCQCIYCAHFVEPLWIAPVALHCASLRFGFLALGRACAPFAPLGGLAPRINRIGRIHFRWIVFTLCKRKSISLSMCLQPKAKRLALVKTREK